MSGYRNGGGPRYSGNLPGGAWHSNKPNKSGYVADQRQCAQRSSYSLRRDNGAQLSCRRLTWLPRQTNAPKAELQAPSGSESNKDDVSSSHGCDPDMDNAEGEGSDDDDDDDDMSDDLSDEYDSGASDETFETQKKNKWFKVFFQDLETLSVEKMKEQARQWHCPACKKGPGATFWHKGLQNLMIHARTKGSSRVKVHRQFAALLEEELSTRGIPVVSPGEQYGGWERLREIPDHEIVWPPMVIVMNTTLEQGDDGKWKGMGSQELRDYFHGYDAKKVRHAYGPDGHRGMSVLIFESSPVGYIEAERLHRHFLVQRTDRDAWYKNKVRFLPCGKRLLYGYLARKEDVEDFNKHSQEKGCLKYEMRYYHENVVAEMKLMSENNQQLSYVEEKMVHAEQLNKSLEENIGVYSQKLEDSIAENAILRRKAREMHLEYEEQMEFVEKHYHDQIESIHVAAEEREREFEKALYEERANARQCDVDSGTTEDRRLRKEQIQRFMEFQAKDVEKFEAERDELIKVHEEKKVKLKTEYMEKEVGLEKELDAALTVLMEKHKPDIFQASNN